MANIGISTPISHLEIKEITQSPNRQSLNRQSPMSETSNLNSKDNPEYRPSQIDNRVVKSTTEGSLTGLNFDTEIQNGKEVTIMLLTDRYGREHPMRINKQTARQIIKILKTVK